MQGKPLVMTNSPALRLVLEHVTKSLAIDVLIDLCHQDIGEEYASDEAIAEWFTRKIEPVARIRNDRPLDASALLLRVRRSLKGLPAREGVLPINSRRSRA